MTHAIIRCRITPKAANHQAVHKYHSRHTHNISVSIFSHRHHPQTMSTYAAAVVVVLCMATAHAQVFSAGSCPNIPVKKNFDVTKYVGKWYEQSRYFAIFELNAKCVTATYTAKDDGAVSVVNREVDQLTNQTKSIEGEATLSGAAGEGKLSVRFPSVGNFAAPYNVVDTDYASYAVVWSCEAVLGLFNAEFAWILTRDKNPSDDVMKKVQDVLQTSKINGEKFHKTKQDCDNN